MFKRMTVVKEPLKMGWFANHSMKGLFGRALRRLEPELGVMGPLVAMAIAHSCYPGAQFGGVGEKDLIKTILRMKQKPCDPKTACAVTEKWLDRGEISTSSAVRQIWGLELTDLVGLISENEEEEVSAQSEATARSAFDSVIDEYKKFRANTEEGQSELVAMRDMMQQEYQRLPREPGAHAIYCIDRYVDAEVDHKTPGLRGLGRMTDAVPRFAAKHRMVISSFSPSEAFELRYVIKQHILCAYLFVEFIYRLEKPLQDRYTSDALFKQWVPMIYSPPRGILPEDESGQQVQGIWFASTGRQVRDTARKLGLSWTDNDDLGTDRSIVTHYWDAGSTLRYLELELSR